MADSQASPPILRLPPELLQQILSFLSPISLADISRTCTGLYSHARANAQWAPFVQSNLPGKDLSRPPPGQSFMQMYLAHSPYWFLTRNKIWFSDSPHHGQLLVARYSIARRCIEAYALVAERGHLDLEFWSYNPEVIIHTFNPKVQLHLDQPIVRINAASSRSFPSDDHRFQREIMMDMHKGPEGAAELYSMFMLSCPIPPAALGPQTQVWPPMKLPAVERTRNQSADCFRTAGHRPMRLSEISEHTFRIRKWMQFSSHRAGIPTRLGEDVTTYATLPASCYTPTPFKPWRGIWVGDYAGHGCEFLVILQPDEPVPLPDEIMDMIDRMRRRESLDSLESDGSDSWQTANSSMVEENGSVSEGDWMEEEASTAPQEHQHPLLSALASLSQLSGQSAAGNAAPGIGALASSSTTLPATSFLPDVKQYSGQLLAIKLTGDPNVPRGEYTFVAPDIGPDGTVRIAEEDIFRGARVIRSCGHIASTGFIDDMYIPSQLILISENKIAQYWEAFGHISFYQRVEIDQFTQCD